jgi:hypothetical protein
VFSFGYSVALAWSNGVGLRMVVDVLGGYGPLFFSTTGICTSYYFVFSINLVDFILSEYLGMSRNVSECTPKVENDHMNLLHAVQHWKLNAVHK